MSDSEKIQKIKELIGDPELLPWLDYPKGGSDKATLLKKIARVVFDL